jgi:hypothetical protein
MTIWGLRFRFQRRLNGLVQMSLVVHRLLSNASCPSERTIDDISMTRALVPLTLLRWNQAIFICTLTAIVIWLSQSMPAQTASRVVFGIVTDQHREPLRGAIVQIDDQENKVVFSYVTDLSGGFMFRRLNSSDDYRIWATRKSHRSKVVHLSPFDKHQSRPLNLIVRFQ